MNLESNAWEGVGQPLLYQRDGKMGHVDPDPLPPKLLCRMYGCAAAAEWIKHNFTNIACGCNYAL
jgi:hypothetical protein